MEPAAYLWHASPMLIDSHCHLADARFDPDRMEVLRRSRAAGVDQWLVPSACVAEWQPLRDLVQQCAGVHAAFGVHPWFADQWDHAVIPRLRECLSDAVAIGECGLDFSASRPPAEVQLCCLRAQLALAAERNMPVILHACKSLDMVLREMRNFPALRGVVHAFSGSRQQAGQCIAQGLYLGIGGRITYTRARRFRELAAELPLSCLLLETDAPDQPPAVCRKQRNEPAFLVEVATELATIRGMQPSKLIDICNRNARELFRL